MAPTLGGSAMRAAGERHSFAQPRFPYASVFAAPAVAGGRLIRIGGAELRAMSASRAAAGRLASRAALICSGVLRSGSERRTRSLARTTCRLCRFWSRLSIFLPARLSPDATTSTIPPLGSAASAGRARSRWRAGWPLLQRQKIEGRSENEQAKNASRHGFHRSPCCFLTPSALLDPRAPNFLIDYWFCVRYRHDGCSSNALFDSRCRRHSPGSFRHSRRAAWVAQAFFSGPQPAGRPGNLSRDAACLLP
jgi:hypothetical protein